MVNLKMIHEIYDKWLYIESFNRVDCILAAALSHKDEFRSNPIWMFLIGPSGDMKSEQLRALTGWNKVKFLSMLTPKTFVNGTPKIPDEVLYLNNHLLLTTDTGPMLHMNRDDKVEVWAQLRELYDGFIHKTFGTGKRCNYENLFFTWIAGSTPSIDNQILFNQTLGTRELIYRCPEIQSKKLLKQKIRQAAKKESLMREELSQITSLFLEDREYKEQELNDELFDFLSAKADYLCYMRAASESDPFTGELFNDVSPEQPTRILKQLIKLYNSLKSLDDDYPDELAKEIIDEVVRSSAFQIRVKVFDYLIANHIEGNSEFNLSRISEILKIGKKTSIRELNILWNMRILNRRTEPIMYGTNPSDREVYYFSLNLKNEFVQDISQYYNKSPKEELVE